MQKINRPPQDRQLIKLTIRALLSGRVFVCFIACLIPAVLPWLLQLIPLEIGYIHIWLAEGYVFRLTLPMLLISFLATTFVTDPMTVKVAAFFITLNRDPENLPSPLSVCDCFGPGYFRMVKGMLLRSVMIYACAALPILVGALIPGAWQIIDVEGLPVVQISDWGYLFVLMSIAVFLYRSLQYMMVPYVLSEEPALSAMETMRRSIYLTKGRLFELLMLQLSFFGWLLFTSITLMLGAIYTYPYIEGTVAAYYLAYTQPMPWEEPIRTPNAS